MKKWAVFVVSFLTFIIFSVFTELSNWEALSVALFVHFMLDFLQNLGKKVVIFDITILLATATCLVMPAIFYHYYTRDNRLAHIWIKYMLIPSDEYFSFAFPAVLMMILGFRAPLGRSHIDKNPYVYMQRMQQELQHKPRVGMILISVGLVSGLFTNFVPEDIKQFFYFLDHLIYVGV
ncbi:MAG TPA: hypothetical protein VK543_11220, partial [Puia sp.]|nr:hypothetical protein [Puia sp.]